MKKLLLSLLVAFCLLSVSYGQTVPQGMKYQAVARNSSGNVLVNQKITLRINLVSRLSPASTTHYTETHSVTTNQLGLFDLVIGQGTAETGTFANVPWSSEDIWMEISSKDNEQQGFTTVSNSRLLAVPYAYYAVTAGQLSAKPVATATARQASPLPQKCPCDGELSQIKVLYTGPASATATAIIKAYRNDDLTELLATFPAVKSGDILTISGTNFSDGKLKDITYLKVQLKPFAVAEVVPIPTKCTNDDNDGLHNILGESFGDFSVLARRDKKTDIECTVCDVRVDWKVGGNGLMDLCTRLGSKSYTDLVLITNNIDRLKITKDGDIILNSSGVGSTTVNGPTTLKKTLSVEGVTKLSNPTSSSNPTTGALVVTGGAGIGGDLNIGGKANFGGSTSFNGKLIVTDATGSSNTATGAAVITGGVGIGENLNVGGTTNITKNLNVNGSTSLGGITTISNNLNVVDNDAGFVAMFTNTNDGSGDGLQIKLGKTHPRWNGTAFANVPNPITIDFDNKLTPIKNAIYGTGTFGLGDLVGLAPSGYLAGSICNLTNYIVPKINSGIGLPLDIATPINTALSLPIDLSAPINSGLGLPYTIAGATVIPTIPSLTIPKIPTFSLPAIPQLACDGLPTLTVPVFALNNVTNSLDKGNEFISFVDKDNRKLGSIRAESINNFADNRFDGQGLLKFAAAVVGLDLLKDIFGFIATASQLTKDYNNIGVEYSSGNGDYAEWLERTDVNEDISFGDIVAVKGGKITKTLAGAEQLMAVSKKPIVLGNMPEESKIKLGNNIAFMGQIPVKVIGAVQAGNYIVAKGEVPGYGVAIHPENMTVEDYKLVVGRSWDTNENPGPKMVNTVVGVHNNDFLNIISDLQKKNERNNDRLNAIESLLDVRATNKAQAKK